MTALPDGPSPCTYCGSTPTVESDKEWHNDIMDVWAQVCCSNGHCSFCGPMKWASNYGRGDDWEPGTARDEAIMAWNVIRRNM